MKININANAVAIVSAIISFISMLILLKQVKIQQDIQKESGPNFRINKILSSYAISNSVNGTTKLMFYTVITNLSNKPMVIEKIRLKVVGENEEIILKPVIDELYMYDGYNISANNSTSQWVCFEIKNNIKKSLKIIQYVLIIEDLYKNVDTKIVIWLEEKVGIDEKKS